MRKQFKLLLVLATILALFVTAMIVGSAEDESSVISVTTGAELEELVSSTAESGQVIRLENDITVQPLVISKHVTIDGNGYTITLNPGIKAGAMITIKTSATIQNATLVHSLNDSTNTESLFSIRTSGDIVIENVVADNTGVFLAFDGGTVGSHVLVKNCDFKTSTTQRAVSMSKKYAPELLTFDNCKLTAPNSEAFKLEGKNATVPESTYTFHDCTVVAGERFLFSDTHPAFYYITGKTTVTAEYFTHVAVNGTEVHVGEVGADDNDIQVSTTHSSFWARNDRPIKFVINSGTFTALEGSVFSWDANGGDLVTNGGTFVATAGTTIVGGTAAADVTGKLLINKGTFKLDGGATFLCADAKPAAYVLPAEAAPGDVKIYLGAGSADNADVQKFFAASAWGNAKTHFYIFGWGGASSAGSYEFVENWQGTLDELRALVENFVQTSQRETYEGLKNDEDAQAFFTSGENQNLFILPSTLPAFVVKNNAVVTVNGGVYATDGIVAVLESGELVLKGCEITIDATLADIRGGKLTLEDCKIIGTSENALIVLSGAGAALELKGNGTLEATNAPAISIASADCGTVTVNGGTIAANTTKPVFTSEVVGGVAGKIAINKGVFNLNNGATLVGGTLTGASLTLPAAGTAGDIKFYMGAGTADDLDTQAFFNTTAWSGSGAHFYVTGWGAGNASTYEFKENFTGTLEEYKQMLVSFIPTAPGLSYGSLSSSIFVENTNLFVQLEIVPEMLPFTITDNNVTVTLNGWNYTAGAMLAVIKGGKLVLTDCNITANVPTGALLYVEGEGAVIEVTSGTYTSDMECFFGAEAGTLKISGGSFVNTKGDLVRLTGAATVVLDPATAETVLDVAVKGKLIYADGASNSTVSIKGGHFAASDVDLSNTINEALIVYTGNTTGATLTIDGGSFEATRMLVANDVGVVITVNNGTFVSNYVLSDTFTTRPENAHMFILGGTGVKLNVHGGSFDNKGGNYLFAFIDSAGATVVIDGGAFNGAGWAYILEDCNFTVNANSDTTKNPVFTDTDGLATDHYFYINNAGMDLRVNAGTYTAGTNKYYIFGVLKGKIKPFGGSYAGSIFYVTKDSGINTRNSTFTVAGNDATLFYIEGTGITKTHLSISNGNVFNVSKGACIFDTTLDAETVKTFFTGKNPLSKVVVSDYAKMAVTLSGIKTFAGTADAIALVKNYFPAGAIEFNDGAACALIVYGKVDIAITGGEWTYAGDYLFTLMDGGSFTVSGGTFNITDGGLLHVVDNAVAVTIGNTENAELAPSVTLVNGLGGINIEAADSTLVIHNGSFSANDYLDFNMFTLNTDGTIEVTVNGGSFGISVGSRYDASKLQVDSAIFYILSSSKAGIVNLTVNGGSFTAARMIWYYTAAGTLNIYGGEFTSNAVVYDSAYLICLRHKQNVLNIYGGTFTGNKYNLAIVYTTSGQGTGTFMTINIYGGKFNKGLHWIYVGYKTNITIDKLDGAKEPLFNGLSDGGGSNYGSNVTPHGFYTSTSNTGGQFIIKAGEFRVPSPQNYSIFTFGSGDVTIEGGEFEGAHYIIQFTTTRKGSYTIKGGHFVMTDAGNLIESSGDASDNVNMLLIEGGTFEARDNATLFSVLGLSANSTILIKGGTFSSADARLAFFEGDTATNFIIEGGTFTTEAARMFYVDCNATPLIIRGGTFILEDRTGNNADSGIIYAVGKNPAKVIIAGGIFVDERSRSNQTFIKMNPKAVVEFAGPFKMYVAKEKTNFYYDHDDNANSIPFVQQKETYNDKEYYVCFGYYNELAPNIYNAPTLRPVAGAEGMTFSASVSAENAAHLATLGTVSYGTLIFPTKYLPNGWQNGTDFLAELKAYAQANNKSESAVYAMVNAANGVVYAEDGSLTIRASIINIKEQNYTLDLAGIAYAKVTAADGTETYYYASHVSAGVFTNMRAVAKNAIIEDLNTKAIADGARVYCYTAIMKKDRFCRYDARFQDSLRKYLAEADRAPKW